MIGLASFSSALFLLFAIPTILGLAPVVYLTVKYTPVIIRIFQAQPLFMPLKVTPVERGELVDFQTADGLRLSGSYLRARTEEQAGVIVYCHEYLSDRWSFRPYVDQLRDLGYDVFTFDYRNHGSSDLDRTYAPLQWTTEHEIEDLRAALAYLRTRDDHDPAGFGLFGVSRGGATALITAATEADVWGVVTDGAFPTQGTMVAYIVRWAQIYVPSEFLRSLIPMWLYGFLARTARLCTEWSLGCRFPSVERAVSRLTPRPWLMIHGQRDTYIGPEIAQALFDRGEDPKEFWLVPEAKHNRCRETAPEAYAARLQDYLARFAPRRPLSVTAEVSPKHRVISSGFAHQLAPALAREVAAPIPG